MGLSIEDLEIMFRSLEGCCLHSPVWTPKDAERVLCSVWDTYCGEWQDITGLNGYGDWKSSTDSDSYTVVLLKDGHLGLLSESEDYTGHGCQCNSATNVYDSLDELLTLGITDDGARDAVKARIDR